MYTLEDGEYLIKLARRVLDIYLNSGKIITPPEDAPENLKKKAGVFVTLETYPEENLRGCIGFPEPTYSLVEGTIKAAIAAGVEDPRFQPMLKHEINHITIEVSVLTPPEPIVVSSPMEYPEKIKVGRDGLIIEKGFAKGLLLPQVPVEHGWNEEEFLIYTCTKAGLSGDCWLDRNTKVYSFEGKIFKEKEPGENVVEKVLGGKSCSVS